MQICPLATPYHHPCRSNPKDFGTKVKELVWSLAKRGKAAAQLIAKQAERTKLQQVTRPSLYHALGKQVYAEGKFRDEFIANYQTIDTLHGEVTKLEAHSASQPKVEGIAAKAKSMAKATQDMVQVKALTMKFGHALSGLGRATFEKHGEQSGPGELTQPIVAAQARVAALDAEIGQLSQAKPEQIFTPKRIVIGGVPVVCVLLLIFVTGIFHSRSNRSDTREDSSEMSVEQQAKR